MNSGIGDQIGLEFSDINIEGTIESQGSSQGRNDLSDQSVQVGVSGSFDIQLSSAYVIDGFVIKHNGDVSMFQQRVGGKDTVVRFNNGGGDLGGRIDGESQLGFFTIINRESFQKEGSQSGTSSSSDGVEDHESLESSTVVSQLSDSI